VKRLGNSPTRGWGGHVRPCLVVILAPSAQTLACLSTQDINDHNALIRALALRTMSAVLERVAERFHELAVDFGDGDCRHGTQGECANEGITTPDHDQTWSNMPSPTSCR
jgi:hypothetical protein